MVNHNPTTIQNHIYREEKIKTKREEKERGKGSEGEKRGKGKKITVGERENGLASFHASLHVPGSNHPLISYLLLHP